MLRETERSANIKADLAVDSGQALLDLGDTARAHQLITEGERLLPTARDKTKGVFLAYRAASYLDQKEPEPAVSAHPAASAWSTTCSPASSPTPAPKVFRSSSNSPPPSAKGMWLVRMGG
ncbi:hypothetical protein [Streptomyces sp. NPDC101455]|uniref:hypothetical protein n=1 Tax=Streptomyces sp. NPDC101455 TaxID=3366142 RepID=UPI003823CC8E